MSIKKRILAILLIMAIILVGFFAYRWWQAREKPNDSSGRKLSKLTIEDRLSFSFSDDTWQIEKESPLGFYIDGQLIHKKLEKCNVWFGIDGTEICMEGEEDCEIVAKEEKKAIASNNKGHVERQIWRIKKQGTNYILAHYDIFREETLFYSLELYTVPADQQRCISDFEKILENFKFIEE